MLFGKNFFSDEYFSKEVVTFFSTSKKDKLFHYFPHHLSHIAAKLLIVAILFTIITYKGRWFKELSPKVCVVELHKHKRALFISIWQKKAWMQMNSKASFVVDLLCWRPSSINSTGLLQDHLQVPVPSSDKQVLCNGTHDFSLNLLQRRVGVNIWSVS